MRKGLQDRVLQSFFTLSLKKVNRKLTKQTHMIDKELLARIQAREHFYENVECLEKHVTEYFEDAEAKVFHEILSLDFHLDVYLIKPKDSPYNILITSGMSLLPMTVPDKIENADDYRFAELMLLLPKDIEFGEIVAGEGENDWIVSMLKETARFPHHYDTFITEGHTLQATYEMDPYCDQTEFTGVILLPSASFSEEFTEIECNGRKINIYNLYPLYKNEMEYKIANGYSAFFDLLIAANANDGFDNQRENLVK